MKKVCLLKQSRADHCHLPSSSHGDLPDEGSNTQSGITCDILASVPCCIKLYYKVNGSSKCPLLLFEMFSSISSIVMTCDLSVSKRAIKANGSQSSSKKDRLS